MASAGSSSVGFRAGVTTVRIDVYTDEPLGIIKSIQPLKHIDCPLGSHVIDYLNWILVKGHRPDVESYDLTRDEDMVNTCLRMHDDFRNSANSPFQYFDFSSIKLSKKEHFVKFLIRLLGLRMYKHIIP